MSADAAREWLQRADADLEIALVCSYTDASNACYHLQQGMETAIKAAITFYNFEIPHTHDLDTLVEHLKGWSVSNAQLDWRRISSWVIARYPGSGISITEADVTYGIEAANTVIDSVRADIDVRS